MSRRSSATGPGSGLLSATGLGRVGGGASRLAMAAALLAVAAGCATKGDVRDLREDLLEEMQERAARQDSILAEIEQRQRESQERLVEQQVQVIEEFRRNLDRRLTSLEDELLRTQEIAGQSQRQMARLQDQIEALGQAAPPRGGVVPRDGGNREEDDPWGGAEAGEEGEEAELFDASIQALERGQTGTARSGFEALVDEFPNHPLVPRARYYLADIRSREAEEPEEYEEAIEAFLDIARYHPGADAVPEAYLRVGEIHLEELDDEAEARDYFQRVVESFPDSEAAQLAQDRLDELG